MDGYRSLHASCALTKLLVHIKLVSGPKVAPQVDAPQGTAEAIPLPDIKEMLKKKDEEEKARLLEESLKDKRRIKRSDKAAFARVRHSFLRFVIVHRGQLFRFSVLNASPAISSVFFSYWNSSRTQMQTIPCLRKRHIRLLALCLVKDPSLSLGYQQGLCKLGT